MTPPDGRRQSIRKMLSSVCCLPKGGDDRRQTPPDSRDGARARTVDVIAVRRLSSAVFPMQAAGGGRRCDSSQHASADCRLPWPAEVGYIVCCKKWLARRHGCSISWLSWSKMGSTAKTRRRNCACSASVSATPRQVRRWKEKHKILRGQRAVSDGELDAAVTQLHAAGELGDDEGYHI